MPADALKKAKWTLYFDQKLKDVVMREAKARGTSPVHLLEELVREKINPYGYTEVKDSVKYVKQLRRKSVDKTDEEFLVGVRRLLVKKPENVTDDLSGCFMKYASGKKRSIEKAVAKATCAVAHEISNKNN